jgi:GAF domain-containing protein
MLEIPRHLAFCNRTLLQRSVFAVEDLSKHPEFAGHPAVMGDPHLRFYAGAPVLDAAGFALGSLCVMGFTPKEFDSERSYTLLTLAQLTSEAVQLRNANRQLRWSRALE